MNKVIKFKLTFVVVTILLGTFATILVNDPYFLEFFANKTGVLFLPSLIEISSILLFLFSLLLLFPEFYSAVQNTTQTSSEEKKDILSDSSKKSLKETLNSKDLDDNSKLELVKKIISENALYAETGDAENSSEYSSWKEPLIDARTRLVDENKRLGERGTSNLTWGVMLSLFTITAAIVIIVITGRVSPPEKLIPLIALYGPRVTLVIVAQIVAGFFLGMYVRNEKDLSKNKNEITNLNLRIAAGMMAKSKEDLSCVVSQLAKEERNFIIHKKEKTAFSEPANKSSELLASVKSLISEAKK